MTSDREDREGRHGIKPDALIADRVTMPLAEYQRLIKQRDDAADRADAAEARVAAGLALADQWRQDGFEMEADMLRAALAPAQGETDTGRTT